MPTNTKHLRYQLTCLTMRYLTTAMQYLFGIMFDIAPILTNQNNVVKRLKRELMDVQCQFGNA
ncbi:hypothetical protein T12_5924 [Trichinella patagoniensis]|uniref:Uncharacterized protein n=1 Tax=Trichinella patagoniensis TaxID=990121 RepID=A0A0V1AFH3_9BILA|nr:hypothetical protein T12_5924 [Trichinella patagoniensis]